MHLLQFASVVVGTLADGQRGVDGDDAAVADVHFGKQLILEIKHSFTLTPCRPQGSGGLGFHAGGVGTWYSPKVLSGSSGGTRRSSQKPTSHLLQSRSGRASSSLLSMDTRLPPDSPRVNLPWERMALDARDVTSCASAGPSSAGDGKTTTRLPAAMMEVT